MDSNDSTPAFNPQQKRPLEIRVRDMKADGGLSEADAVRLGRHTADALVLIRFLADGDRLVMQLHTQNGATQKELGVEALFGAWLRLTAHIIAMPAEDDMKKRQGFLAYVLKLLNLDERLQVIQNASGGPGSHSSPAGAAQSSSD